MVKHLFGLDTTRNGLLSQAGQYLWQGWVCWQRYTPVALKTIAIASLSVTSLVWGIRQTGGLQHLEVQAFDQLTRLRGDQTTDPRLLVVTVTEDDIRTANRWPLSDQVVEQTLNILQTHEPQAIGLDFFRDIPYEPGHSQLKAQLQRPNVFAITYLGNAPKEHIPPPPSLNPEQAGFSDLLTDPDGIVRRSLLFATYNGKTFTSFAMKLALAYLAGDCPQRSPLAPEQPVTCQAIAAKITEQGEFQIGSTIFHKLHSHSGGYQTIDARGYQFLLSYPAGNRGIRQITLQQVLQRQFRPEWVRGKVVLIGSSANSVKDLFFTPYSIDTTGERQMPGVVVHAQAVSQILGAVLDQRSLFWYWSQEQELLWIGAWATVGGILAWRFRHPLSLSLASLAAIGSLLGISFLIFLQVGWIPLIPPAIALILTVGGVVAYQLVYHTRHDLLTGLPNRAHFLQRLQQVIRKTKQQPSALFAVLFLDLDRFKLINDSLGHTMGDRLLVAVTRRIQSCLGPGYDLARVGGDEFAIVLVPLQDRNQALQLADQLHEVMNHPFRLRGQSVFMSISVGIAFNQSAQDYQPATLLRDAHTALYRAKVLGKARYEIFAEGMHQQVVKRLQIETDLRIALDEGQFLLNYQPIVSLTTGKIAGFEALVRWQHPVHGLISPTEFIPIAEETGLIDPLGQWVLQEACCQLQIWQAQFPSDPPLIVSVNLSGHQFMQPDLADRIEQILLANGLDGKSIKLEITETVAMKDVDLTIGLLLRLRSLDVRLSLDDFGTGYSSLSYLHRFPVDTLKVDRSFISRMGDTSEDATIVQTITMLGHNLGMDVIAEGVETNAQYLKLQALKCEYGQGYLFSKPLDSEAATALLAAEFTQKRMLPESDRPT